MELVVDYVTVSPCCYTATQPAGAYQGLSTSYQSVNQFICSANSIITTNETYKEHLITKAKR